jgi:hypothetical protein
VVIFLENAATLSRHWNRSWSSFVFIGGGR